MVCCFQRQFSDLVFIIGFDMVSGFSFGLFPWFFIWFLFEMVCCFGIIGGFPGFV